MNGDWAAGTAAYMALEQFDASDNTDLRSDMYSFGVTFLKMLAGQKPFSGHEHEECSNSTKTLSLLYYRL